MASPSSLSTHNRTRRPKKGRHIRAGLQMTSSHIASEISNARLKQIYGVTHAVIPPVRSGIASRSMHLCWDQQKGFSDAV